MDVNHATMKGTIHPKHVSESVVNCCYVYCLTNNDVISEEYLIENYGTLLIY